MQSPEINDHSLFTEIIKLSTEQVKSLLPYDEPALLINSAVINTDKERTGGSITAEYFVNPSFPILPGHFPGNPIFRGVDVVESMAQACILLGLHLFGDPGSTPYFNGLTDVDFFHKVKPGDNITLKADFLEKTDESNRRLKKTKFTFRASALKKEKYLAGATIFGAITSMKK